MKKRLAAHPYFTQSGRDREENGDQYIANMRDGATAGFKYFDFRGNTGISVALRGNADGRMLVSTDPDGRELAASIPVKLTGAGAVLEAPCAIPDGVHPLYFRYDGEGAVDFIGFDLR